MLRSMLAVFVLIGWGLSFIGCERTQRMLDAPSVTTPVGPEQVLIYIGDTWYITPEAATAEAETTKSLLHSAGIQAEMTEDGDYVRQWMLQTADDGDVNVLMLYGVIPNAIYPTGNTQTDGSVAENWIESPDGNTILNQADYIGWNSDGDSYVKSEGGFTQELGTANRGAALQNLMDIPDIAISTASGAGVGSIPMIVTGDGSALTPSLVDFSSDRPFPLDQFQGEWFAERVLASDTGDTNATLADPVIVRDGDRGRIAIVHQTFFEDDPKGEVAAELIINYLLAEFDAVIDEVESAAGEVAEEEIGVEVYEASADPSLMLYFSFDELNGTQAIDHSQHQNHGTLVGNPVLVEGKFGKALEFNGESDYVEVPHDDSLTVDQNVTVMAWIHTPRHHGPKGMLWQGIIAKGNDPRSYSFYTEDGGALHLSVNNFFGSDSEAKVALNEWQHVVAQVDNGVHRYWINGKNAGVHRFTRDDETIDSEGQTSLPGTTDRASVRVGNTHDVSPLPDRHFLGRIDEVRVWNRALSEAEILEQMNMGTSGTAANP